MSRSQLGGDDAGETLVESVIALAILAVSIVGILGAFGASTSFSTKHRTATTAKVVLSQFAESVKAGGYVVGATTGQVVTPNFTAVAGFPATVVLVQCWNGVGNQVSSLTDFPTCTATNDNGLQAVTIKVASADGEAVATTTVFKRSTN